MSRSSENRNRNIEKVVIKNGDKIGYVRKKIRSSQGQKTKIKPAAR